MSDSTAPKRKRVPTKSAKAKAAVEDPSAEESDGPKPKKPKAPKSKGRKGVTAAAKKATAKGKKGVKTILQMPLDSDDEAEEENGVDEVE